MMTKIDIAGRKMKDSRAWSMALQASGQIRLEAACTATKMESVETKLSSTEQADIGARRLSIFEHARRRRSVQWTRSPIAKEAD